MSKYLIIYPKGGFTDIIRTINTSLLYAVKTNRQLVINSNSSHFDITKYVSFNHANILCDDENIFYNTISELSVFPEELKGNLEKFETKCLNKIHNFITKTGEIIPLTIDFAKDYDEDIIVCSLYTKVNIFNSCFNYINIKDFIVQEYHRRVSCLPKEYISFHIRNTDHKSDIFGFVEMHREKMSTLPFFIASDDQNAINYIMSEFPKNAYTFSKGSIDGIPLHFLRNKTDDYERETMINCICDLLLLVYGKEYYFSCHHSGYSKIAGHFHKNKEQSFNISSDSR